MHRDRKEEGNVPVESELHSDEDAGAAGLLSPREEEGTGSMDNHWVDGLFERDIELRFFD